MVREFKNFTNLTSFHIKYNDPSKHGCNGSAENVIIIYFIEDILEHIILTVTDNWKWKKHVIFVTALLLFVCLFVYYYHYHYHYYYYY